MSEAAETPEQRRDAAVAAVQAAGGVILDPCVPLATPEEPHVIVAYRLSVGAPTLEAQAALREVQRDTQLSLGRLIEWTPEPDPEPAPAEPVEDLPDDRPEMPEVG